VGGANTQRARERAVTVTEATWLAALAVSGSLGALAEPTVTGGIVTFAIGIVLGVVCVLLADRIVRGRINRDYHEWTQAGRPERRRAARGRRRSEQEPTS
jgi:hypothetical protein